MIAMCNFRLFLTAALFFLMFLLSAYSLHFCGIGSTDQPSILMEGMRRLEEPEGTSYKKRAARRKRTMLLGILRTGADQP